MKISVALCTYNGADFLDLQLKSILGQTLPVDEIIIVDDNSEDDTDKVLHEFREQCPQVIKLFKNEVQLGFIKNFEKAITLCRGNWIFLSDQDDIWEKDKVEKMIAFASTRPAALLIYTDARLIDGKNESLKKNLWEEIGYNQEEQEKWKKNGYAFRQLATGKNRITGATMMMSALLKEKAIPFLQLPLGFFHDAYLALMAASENGLYFLNSPLISYRIHSNQQMGIEFRKFVSSAESVKYKDSFNDFLKQVAKKLNFKYRVILFIIQLKKSLSELYHGLPKKTV